MPIKKKILVAFLPIVLLSVLSVAIFGLMRARLVVLRAVTAHLDSIADLKREKIETFFERLKGDVRIVQDYYNVRLNLPVLIRYSKDPTDRAYVKATKTLDDQLHALVTEKKEITDLMLLAPDGTVVYASNQQHKQLDVSHTLAVIDKATFDEGKKKLTLSRIFRPPSTAYGYQFGLLVAAPVFDLEDRFAGEVVFEIDMDPIYKFIQDATGLGDTGETLVIKDEGDHVLFLNPLRHDPDAALRRKIGYGDKLAIPAQRAAKGGNGSGVAMDYRGVPVLTAWRFMPSLGWSLVAKMDMGEVLATITKTRNVMVAVLFAIIMVMALISWMVAESISKPIRVLHEGAEIIGAGNLDYKVGTDTQDEVGRLSRAFDRMTEKLRAEVRAKEELSATISHEIRTPMTVIAGDIDIILDGIAGEINDQQRGLLTIVRESSDRLVRLVTDVLDLEKMESGHTQNVIRENDINEIVNNVCKSMSVLATENDLELLPHLDGQLPLVACDRDQIIQVLVNLVGNAIKFTAKGGISVITRREDGGVHVMVQDSGPGIREEDLSRLFQPFEQLNVVGGKKWGTGLGLAISKKIILSHNGKIWAESECGKGTTIHFILPVKERNEGVKS